MRRSGRHRRGRNGLAARVAVGLLAAAVAYLGVSAAEVWLAARRDGARPAGAIVVLGAAQYHGHASPVLRARLDHAIRLHESGVAPMFVVTGGKRPGDVYNQAHAAARYLHAAGVPDDRIVREVDGRDTWEELAATAHILRARRIERVVLVTDPLHARRVALTAREAGIDGTVSPRPSRTRTLDRLRTGARESVAVAVGRLVGFRRLSDLRRRL